MASPGRPFVALLTDFGTRDPYIAAMKLAIAARTDADIVDLGHEIAPHDVFEAAVFLQFALRSLEEGRRAVIVTVVDPGVGSERRIVAASSGSRILLAPDNGVLTLAAGAEWEVRSAENETLFVAGPSSTFHGRDRFAPLAAALAAGTPPSSVGPVIPADSLVRLRYERPHVGASEVRGAVISVDRFGNLVTDVDAESLGDATAWWARAGVTDVTAHARTYAERDGTREPFLIVGSRGTMEISVARGSAADVLQIGRLDPVVFRRGIA